MREHRPLGDSAYDKQRVVFVAVHVVRDTQIPIFAAAISIYIDIGSTVWKDATAGMGSTYCAFVRFSREMETDIDLDSAEILRGKKHSFFTARHGGS